MWYNVVKAVTCIIEVITSSNMIAMITTGIIDITNIVSVT